MSEKVLLVYFGEEKAGTITQSQNAKLSFTYDDSWRFAPGATPLSMSMPLTTANHSHEVVEAFIDGLLPDNDDVRERWGREFHVSARNPFALLKHVGNDVSGGARFVVPGQSTPHNGALMEMSERDIADHIRALRSDPLAWHFPGSLGQFSLAGAQRKFALLRHLDGWAMPSGDFASTHIFKLPVPGYEDQHVNEHLCANAASELGLIAERSEIVTFDSEQVIVLERYDRWHDGERTIRIHQEDMCQALGVRTQHKYQNEGGPTPAEIVALLRREQPNSDADESTRRFVDALLFSWLVVNTDAHAKNYSVMLRGPQMRLAPLYDVASMAPYEDQVHLPKVNLAMKIGNEYRALRIAGRHWKSLATDIGIDENYVTDRAEELCDGLVNAFVSACSDPAVVALHSPLPKRLLEAMNTQSTHCRQMLKL